MTLTELHSKLKSSYTQNNLHIITTKIIDLYKSRQYSSIEEIMNVVSEHTKEAKEQQNKAFYRLMMIYHPDRITHYQSQIEKHFRAGDLEQLLRYAHIFPVLELERTLKVEPQPLQEYREPEEHIWDEESEEFNETEIDSEDGTDQESFDDLDEPIRKRSFFSAFKQSVYGSRNIELPYYYLEELEILDMSGYEINDLDGVGHCTNMINLDLSNNRIDDVADLSTLSHLREIYLAGNHIGYIDALSYCSQLRIVDISYNDIDDISPLLELKELEYVNIIGNAIPSQQVALLKKRNVMVIV